MKRRWPDALSLPAGREGGGDALGPERHALHRRGAGALPPLRPAGLPAALQPRARHLRLVGAHLSALVIVTRSVFIFMGFLGLAFDVI